MLFDYLLIALVVALIFTTAWTVLLVLTYGAMEERFFNLMRKADKAIEEQDFAEATYYNEKLSRLLTVMNKVEDLMYFKFF